MKKNEYLILKPMVPSEYTAEERKRLRDYEIKIMHSKSNSENKMVPSDYTSEEREILRNYERKIMNSKKYNNSNEER